MNAENGLVSIIIPCYNQAQYLPQALASVLAQSHTHWECIIVNDGSSDNTERVAKEWTKKDARLIYVKKLNGGLSSARNAGLDLANGKYIQFLDADDILETDKITQQLSAFSKLKDQIDVAVSGYRYFKFSTKAEDMKIFGPVDILPEVALLRTDKKDLLRLFSKKNPMVISAPLYHSRVFKRVGLFDESLYALEDWDFHFRCALEGIVFQHIGFADNTKALVRVHHDSMMHNKQRMKRNLGIFLKKHKRVPVFAKEHKILGPGTGAFRAKLHKIVKLLVPPVLLLGVRSLYKVLQIK